jgi:hypothetical protein
MATKQEMATKQKVVKALVEIGATLTQQPGRAYYDDFEMIAPEGKVWAGNFCEVLCYQYDKDIMTKAEFWYEVLTDIEQGLLDESEAGQ